MKALLIASLFALGACASKTAAPEANVESTPVALPTAESLFEAYIDASKQKQSLEGLNSLKSTSVMRIVQAGIEAQIVTSWAAPDQILVEQDIPGVGSGSVGYNGETGWSSDNMMGPRLIEGKELDELLLDSSIHADINFRDWYTEMETVSQTSFNDLSTYEVKATTRFGRVTTLYFDTTSKLKVGAAYQMETPLGPIMMELFLQEYAEIDGIMLPNRSQITQGPMTMEVELLSLEKNPELPEDIFAVPPEIQELLEEAETTEEAEESSPQEDAPEAP